MIDCNYFARLNLIWKPYYLIGITTIKLKVDSNNSKHSNTSVLNINHTNIQKTVLRKYALWWVKNCFSINRWRHKLAQAVHAMMAPAKKIYILTIIAVFSRRNTKDVLRVSIEFYIITQVLLAFWLVLAYDLLEDRRTIDVTITKFFPLPF